MTPKLKYLIFLKSFKYVLIFIKINLQIFNTNVFYFLRTSSLLLFYRYFYYFKLLKFFNIINLNLVGNYNNNLKKSIVFYNFKFLDNVFEQRPLSLINIAPKKHLLFNQYYTSIKIVNFQLNKRFFQSVFFYFLNAFSYMWVHSDFLFKFYLNFFFASYSLNMYKFYNGRFFKVYNI